MYHKAVRIKMNFWGGGTFKKETNVQLSSMSHLRLLFLHGSPRLIELITRKSWRWLFFSLSLSFFFFFLQHRWSPVKLHSVPGT